MNVPRIPILLAACALSRPIAAQDKPSIEYVFSGSVAPAVCDQLPAPTFSVGPSMDRYKLHDNLVIKCDPSSHTLSLIFEIDSTVPPARGFRAYSFRWGAAMNPRHPGFGGQFTKDRQQCIAVMDLFKANIPQTIASSSGPILRSPHWTAGCGPDDLWGTSMEIYLNGDDPKSH